MLSFEETQEALDELTAELPPEIFKNLNCGVVLTQQTLYDDTGRLILGQYHYQPRGLGRYVNVHYGSMMRVYAHLRPEEFRKALKDVLYHELTHHLENMAGDRSLEITDEINKVRYIELKEKR